jgi:hypothetical protein
MFLQIIKRQFATSTQQKCAYHMKNNVKMDSQDYKILCYIVRSSDINNINNINNPFYDLTSSYDHEVQLHLDYIKSEYDDIFLL